MKIDQNGLQKKGACQDGKDWFVVEGISDPIKGLKNFIAKDKLEWANWLIVRRPLCK